MLARNAADDPRVEWVRRCVAAVLDAPVPMVASFFSQSETVSALIKWFECVHAGKDDALYISRVHFADSSSSARSPSISPLSSPRLRRRDAVQPHLELTTGLQHPEAGGAMYFLKCEPGVVGVDVTDDELCSLIDFATLGDNELEDLQLLLDGLYRPFIEADSKQMEEGGGGGGGGGAMGGDGGVEESKKASSSPVLGGRSGGGGGGSGGGTSSRVETGFAGALSVFSSNVSHALEQVCGTLNINVPVYDHPAFDKPELIRENDVDGLPFDIQMDLERVLESWTVVVAQLVERETEKLADASSLIESPLDEIKFWRKRDIVLSTLVEQIKLPNAQRLVTAMRELHFSGMIKFDDHVAELGRIGDEAKDNVKVRQHTL